MKPLRIYLDSELRTYLPIIKHRLKDKVDSGEVILQEDTPNNATLGIFEDAADRSVVDWLDHLPFIHFGERSNHSQAKLIKDPIEIISIVQNILTQ